MKMDIKELKKHIADADEDILQDIITEWLKGHEDFRKHVEAKLCPAADDIDFGYELCPDFVNVSPKNLPRKEERFVDGVS